MKKILLTSALILSIAGLAPASVSGEENTTQSTSAVKESIAKEEKKESSVEENSKSEVLPKVDVQEDKPKKEGWYQENHHWRFYQDDKPALNWKQIQGKWYYFDQDGNRLHSTIYKGYAFDQDGVMVENSWTNLDNQINGIMLIPLGDLLRTPGKKLTAPGTILTKLEACSATPPLTAICSQIVELWQKRVGLN